jgi:aspartate aminotransferase
MHISNRIRSIRPLATTALHGRAEQLKAQGHDVIDLAIAISDQPAPDSVIERITEGLRTQRQPYTSVVGDDSLRQSLVHKLKIENGIDAAPNEIIVTNGAKQAVYEALYALTDPGDSVIVFRPYWPANVAIPELQGVKPILVDLPDEVTPELLAALPPARAMLLNNPHNPSGKVFTRKELEHIRDWALKNKVQVICDECYEKLIYEGEHVSFATLCDWREAGVVTIFSASQSYAMMGWRAGFALAPAPVVQAMEALQGPITAAASAITQTAAAAAFAIGDPVALKENYRKRRDVAVQLFANAPWAKTHSLHSGPYLWVDISALTTDTLAFVEALLEKEKIAVMPGEALGCKGFIRLSFISHEADILRKAAARIIAFGNSWKAR